MTISFFLLTAIYLAIVLTLSPFILSGLQALDEVPKGKLLSSAAWAVLGAIAPRSIYSLGALIPSAHEPRRPALLRDAPAIPFGA